MPTSLPESGFLSPQVKNFRANVHEAHAPFVTLLYEASALATKLQHDIEIHRNSVAEACAAVLFARTIASLQATALLLEHGLPSQARTILRSSLETTFALCAIGNDSTVATEIVASHEADRRTVADRVLRWKHQALREAVAKEVNEQELQALLATKPKSVNHYDLAKRAGLEDWYLSIYTLLSFAAHGAISDLEHHAVVDDDGNVLEFKSEPELQGQSTVWSWATEVTIVAMKGLCSVFGIAEPGIDNLYLRLQAVLARDEAEVLERPTKNAT